MNVISRTCLLRSMNSSQEVILPHGVTVFLGRQKELGIDDVLISKKQMECKADCENCHVAVKPVGANISGCNGFALTVNKTYTFKDGDIIELRLAHNKFKIIFDPPPDKEKNKEIVDHVPDKETHEPEAKKMKYDFKMFNKPGIKQQPQGSSDTPLIGQWEDVDGKDLLIYTARDCISRDAIAGFDIDGTIIKTKSGARFPKDINDWTFLYSFIVKKLNDLYNENHKVVFFTNQAGLGKDSYKIKKFKKKIEDIVAAVGIPIQVFIATGKTKYRKPIPGMWNVLKDNKNGNVPIDLEKCFYVGDAAGRPKEWAPRKKKDHSCADRLFAINIGIPFFTPEEYFLKNQPAKYTKPEFNPTALGGLSYPDLSYPKHNVILMVGGPGSGKSHFCNCVLIPKGYVHVSRDILGSRQKCQAVMEENLIIKKNVVIDNTNPDKKSRQAFIEVAKKYNVDVRCFVMSTDLNHSKHNNKFRELTDKKHDFISEILINKYKKDYQDPDISEGLAQIIKIPFVPHFINPEHERMYTMYLLES